MKIGLVGLPGSGKSTCFRLLTGRQHGGSTSDVAVVEVPDPRTLRIAAIYQSPKIVQPETTFVDLMAVHQGDSSEGEALSLVKVAGDADAFVLVLQCFGELDASGNPLDPAADLETLLLEMALTDLAIVEGRRQRLAKTGTRDPHAHWETEVLEHCETHLSAGGALRDLDLSEEQRKYLRGFSLLTMKPWLVALNVAEEDLVGERAVGARQLAEQRGLPWIIFCAALEAEIEQLPPEERAAFAADYGLVEPGRERLIHAAYRLLEVITFFTGGPTEAHAWTLSAGATAVEAAGRIHTDLEKGFIRAEVISFQDLEEMGSEKSVKEHGRLRVEGRTYVVKDGDILFIRFSR
ncbi:MAG: redox-regulated ATPase YchF [candidate division WS1 bacterium]|nr:redox-regulated ATPase YchF [candidate division WS1 bacterium]